MMTRASGTQQVPKIGSADVRLEVRADVRFLASVREAVAAVARRVGFGDDVSARVALAVDEAVCNVFRHGYGLTLEDNACGMGWVRVGLWVLGEGEEAGLRVMIEDEGRQVDPAEICSRPLDEVRPGGLGVHIIKEVMDEVSYEKREGGVGMRLTMVKRAGGVDEKD